MPRRSLNETHSPYHLPLIGYMMGLHITPIGSSRHGRTLPGLPTQCTEPLSALKTQGPILNSSRNHPRNLPQKPCPPGPLPLWQRGDRTLGYRAAPWMRPPPGISLSGLEGTDITRMTVTDEDPARTAQLRQIPLSEEAALFLIGPMNTQRGRDISLYFSALGLFCIC